MRRYIITWTQTKTYTAEIEFDKDPLENQEKAIEEGFKDRQITEEIEHSQILSCERI